MSKYDQINAFTYNTFKVKRDGKWGIADINFNEIINCQFGSIKDWKNNFSIVSLFGDEMLKSYKDNDIIDHGNGMFGLINDKCEFIIPVKYICFENLFSNYYLIVEYDESHFYGFRGIYDVKNKLEILNCIYKEINHIEKNILEICLDVFTNDIRSNRYFNSQKYYSHLERIKKYIYIKDGIIYCDNENTIQLTCDIEYTREDSYISVYSKNKQGLLNKYRELIVGPKYLTIGLFKEGLSVVSIVTNNSNFAYLFGIINESGLEILNCEYDEINDFYCGISRIMQNNKYGFVNKNGELICKCIFDFADDFENNVSLVVTKDESGTKNYSLIDINGNYIINGYDKIEKIKGSKFYFIVTNNEKSGLIDLNCNTVIPLIYDFIDPDCLENNILIAKLNDKYGAIDYVGNVIISFYYFKLYTFCCGMARFETPIINDRSVTGYINKDNTIIIPPIYHEASDFINGKAYVSIYDENSSYPLEMYQDEIIDKKGNVLETTHRMIDYSEDDDYDHSLHYVYEEDCKPNYYNDELDMDQQSLSYWDNLEIDDSSFYFNDDFDDNDDHDDDRIMFSEPCEEDEI